MTAFEMNDEPPPFDEEFANRLVGKHLLVGLTYLGSSGEFIEQRQLHGIVEDASLAGIRIRLPNAPSSSCHPTCGA